MTRRLAPDTVVLVVLCWCSGWLLVTPNPTAMWVSNVSTTRLLIPLWFGWRIGRPMVGAVAGLVVTWLGLLVYYLPPIVLRPGHSTDVLSRFGVRYFVLGALSGPVMGLAGAWWRRRPTLLVPIAVAASAIGERWAWSARLGFDPAPTVFTVEAVFGVALAVAMGTWTRRAQADRQRARTP